MPNINPNKLNEFRSYVPASGAKELSTEEKLGKVDNNVSVITFFTREGLSDARAFLKTEPAPAQDTGRLAKLIEATGPEIEALKNKPEKLAALLDATLTAKKAYLSPTFPMEGAPSRYKFNNIIGQRIDQFREEATKLARELYTGANLDTALYAVNTKSRDLYNRPVTFDNFEVNGYASFGHDAAFIHVYEKKLAELEKIDVAILTPAQRAGVEQQKKQVQGELDAIFRAKYVYQSHNMQETNAEETIGLVAIDPLSRQRVSELASSRDTIVPQFGVCKVQHEGQNKPVYLDVGENKWYFDGTSQQVPESLVAQIAWTNVDSSAVTFRRVKSGETLREGFRFDWDGNGHVQAGVIDWVSWGGHCNDKAALEAAGLVVPAAHGGVYEYNSASGSTVHYNRDLLNEGLLSFSEMGSQMSKKWGGNPVKDLGQTEYASSRDDDRPDIIALSNGRTLPMNSRPNEFEIRSIQKGGQTYTAEEAFREYKVGAGEMSAEKNPLYKGTTEGDYVNIDLGGAKIDATVKVQVFDTESGYPKMESKNITLDFANPPAEPILIDSQMSSADAARREMYEISLDLKNKKWIYAKVRMEKQPDGKYKKVSIPGAGGSDPFDPSKNLARRETSLDNPSTYLPFVDGAIKTGRSATAETADGAGVWNGRLKELEKRLEKREGSWERVAMDVDARYGSNVGRYLAHLDAKGEPDFYVPLAMPADFWWRQQIAFAPQSEDLVNSTALNRGVVSYENNQVHAEAVTDLLEIMHCAFKDRPYTLVHEGKRYFFQTEAEWKAEIDKLNQLRGAIYTGGTDPGPGPIDPTPGIAVLLNEGGALTKGEVKTFSVTAEADGKMVFELDSQTGDADLYVKKGGPATISDHTYKSWESGTKMDKIELDVKKGETYGIAVHGYEASQFKIKTTGPKLGGGGTTPAPEPLSFHTNGVVTKNQEQHFKIEIKEDAELKMSMTGSGDADIYLRLGEKPTKDKYDVRPYLDGSNESGTIKVKKGQVLYGMVRGYSDRSEFDLNIKS